MDRRHFLRWALAAAATPACEHTSRPPPEGHNPPAPAPEHCAEAIPQTFAPVPLIRGAEGLPIDTIVYIVKENRTFDALFGDFPGADGQPESHEECPDEFEGEIPHGREVALLPREMHRRCHHHAEDVPRYHALAHAYTLCDRFFSEIRGPSFPNHQTIVSGTFTQLDDPPPSVPVSSWRCPDYCYDNGTFPEDLDRAHKTWRAYAQGVFVPTFHMYRRIQHRPEIVPWDQLHVDAAAGRLANVSWVYEEQADSEHPPASVCRGEEWTVRQLRALMNSPQWPRMAVFVIWDDWGGIYDHVEPPTIEVDRRGRPIRYGHRVPCLVVSPYAKPGYISHSDKGFLSIIKWSFLQLGVKLPPGRVADAPSMDDCFDARQTPLGPIELPERDCAHPTRGEE
jgi:phospholipase C